MRDALSVLGIDELVCAVHDRSLPAAVDDDVGCGNVGGAGADGFVAFLAEKGFSGVLLGPPGRIERGNLSPYDGAVFSRSLLNLSWRAAADEGFVDPAAVDGAVDAAVRAAAPVGRSARPANRCDYDAAFSACAALRAALHARCDARGDDDAARAVSAFRRQSRFVDDDAVFFGLGPPLLHAREQWLLLRQHQAFRARANARGVAVLGDLHVGFAPEDRAQHRALFLDGVAMGAPPSRTHAAGQPWGFPVFDPQKLGPNGAALSFVRRRAEKLFAEYDGVRLDHPHGLVCPWVYRPSQAVRDGVRLYSAGAAAGFDDVAAFDVARADQLDPAQPRWADGYVRDLDDDQVDRYAVVFDAIVGEARRRAVPSSRLPCEVLSTLPYPLARVMKRHGLGRFRVTSKADVENAADVYLPENAQPEDWIMATTHDTPSVWAYARRFSDEVRRARAHHAARRLSSSSSSSSSVAALAQTFLSSPAALAQAELAVLFTSRARHVLIFVSDLLGEEAPYNVAGEVNAENWTLRVPHDFRRVHAARCADGRAFDVAAALALAVEARAGDAQRGLCDRLRALSPRR